MAGERTQAPQAALVDASVRRSMNILDPMIESEVEGLAATEAPIFFVLQYGPAIPSREHLSFRFPVLGQGGAGRARF